MGNLYLLFNLRLTLITSVISVIVMPRAQSGLRCDHEKTDAGQSMASNTQRRRKVYTRNAGSRKRNENERPSLWPGPAAMDVGALVSRAAPSSTWDGEALSENREYSDVKRRAKLDLGAWRQHTFSIA